MISASAPGKVMLLGEYAVLEGAPAMLAAVDRLAEVSISAAERSVVVIKGYLDTSAGFSCHQSDACTDKNQGVTWAWEDVEMATKLGLVSTIGEQLLAEAPSVPLQIELDTRPFFEGQNKLGLGSSAALCVALGGALAHYAGDSISLERCQQLHHSFQGSGSGADVAACYLGGTIQYQIGLPPEPLQLPKGLYVALVWTGISSSTPAMLLHLQEYRRSSPHQYKNAIELLHCTMLSILAASRLVTEWLDRIEYFVAMLKIFAKQTKLPIFRSPHPELEVLARNAGTLYKPVGAGGGDLGLVLTDSLEGLADCCAKLEKHGFKTLQPQIAQQGFRVSGHQ